MYLSRIDTLLPLFLSVLLVGACSTDDDCSLNGICTDTACVCDPGWFGDDCGQLNLFPATPGTGYNHTDATDVYEPYGTSGNSSWCGQIVQDLEDKTLFHMIASQFAHGCGLSSWKPMSTVIHAESRSGPAGPYIWTDEILDTWHHNPTIIYSPADEEWLVYFTGMDMEVPESCGSKTIINNVSMISSPDLQNWSEPTLLLPGKTNPAPWPLYTDTNPTSQILLSVEDNPIYLADHFTGPYDLVSTPNYTDWTEDPFLWQDKRGHWHFLVHWMIDYVNSNGTKRGPNVGAHAYARDYEGPWTFNNHTTAFNTTVPFTDGTTIEYYRRERPKVFFSDDGEMTPLYLVTGVQPNSSSSRTYTLVQPIGEAAQKYEESLGF
jgi:hypothetical protein